MDDELVMRRRVGKIFVEAGELADAIEGFTGENPRKGVYATREDVIKELIDCASASLCAIEYMTGDRGDSVRMVADQVAGNWERLQAAIAGGAS
jgi:NTP pyrophosphatase (non-canonical NTP hydrolase)